MLFTKVIVLSHSCRTVPSLEPHRTAEPEVVATDAELGARDHVGCLKLPSSGGEENYFGRGLSCQINLKQLKSVQPRCYYA